VVETLSSFTDTVHDEVNASHWGASDEDGVTDIVEGAEDVKANPEAFVESEFREDSGVDGFNDPIRNPDPEDYNPALEGEEEELDEELGEELEEESQHQMASYVDTAIVKDKIRRRKESEGGQDPDGPGSQLPGGTGEQGQGKTAPEMVMNTTTPSHGNYAASIKRILDGHAARTASSSVPTDTMAGPRVDHIGPGEGNEAGHFNDEDVWPSDDPTGAGISSGTNESNHLLEEWTADGVTGYDNPTDGDSTVLQISSRVAQTYSWLPGSSNEKLMNYYARGLSEEDIEWMRENAQPDPPPGMSLKPRRPDTSGLWMDKP